MFFQYALAEKLGKTLQELQRLQNLQAKMRRRTGRNEHFIVKKHGDKFAIEYNASIEPKQYEQLSFLENNQ